jgi:hypothetical protein
MRSISHPRRAGTGLEANLFIPLVAYFFVTLGGGALVLAYYVYARFVQGVAPGGAWLHGLWGGKGAAADAAAQGGPGSLETWDYTGGAPAAHERESWQINYRELRFGKRVGVGNVGEVYAGLYRGRPVAIKRLLGAWVRDDDMVERFKEEILLMSSMNHANVLQFVGAVLDRDAGNICLVTELCARGTLHDVLHSEEALPWRVRVRMAWEIARGMGYLHTQARVIQRDLKSQNLLVTDHYEVKVADFGLARNLAPGRMETYCGTPATMAPEIVRQLEYDEKADVFSFAVIMWELLTREDPYPGMSGLGLAYAVANEGLRPPVPAYTPAEWAQLMVRSWDADPTLRPSFDYIQRELHALLKALDEAAAVEAGGAAAAGGPAGEGAGGAKSEAAGRGMKRKFMTRNQDVVVFERGESQAGGDGTRHRGEDEGGMGQEAQDEAGEAAAAARAARADDGGWQGGGAAGEPGRGHDRRFGSSFRAGGDAGLRTEAAAIAGGGDGSGDDDAGTPRHRRASTTLYHASSGIGAGAGFGSGGGFASAVSSFAASAKEGLRRMLPAARPSPAPPSRPAGSPTFEPGGSIMLDMGSGGIGGGGGGGGAGFAGGSMIVGAAAGDERQ